MKREIFKKAHKFTKKIIKAGDDYRATFSLVLSFVYNQTKQSIKKIEKKLTQKGYKIWKKSASLKRIYINNIVECAEQFGVKIEVPKAYRKGSMYYDCTRDTFVYSCSSSRTVTFENIIKAIRG